MDTIDKKIISILEQDARTPLKKIAAEVFLTSPAVSAGSNDWKRKGF